VKLALYGGTVVVSLETALLLSTNPDSPLDGDESARERETEREREPIPFIFLAFIARRELRPPLRVIQICCSNAALAIRERSRRRCRWLLAAHLIPPPPIVR